MTFAYDYMSRRAVKQVETYASGAWAVTERLHFVYDGWNVVMVLDGRDGADPDTLPDNTVLRRYTWGLDLSGWAGDSSPSGIHGAGGIGGLLAVEETAATGSPAYWFFHDAMGNVGQLVSDADQSLAAHYEYDPYGNPIAVTGTYAATNPFRFSTKWFDAEAGLGYWGYRYYNPRLGRWMSRDPIGELGGSCLF